MMNRLRLILLLVLLAMTAVWAVLRWKQHRAVPALLADWRTQLQDEDADVRARAAQEILRLRPEDDAVRLDLAQALAESWHYDDAHQALEPLLERDGPNRLAAQTTQAELYLREATRLADEATADSAPALTQRVEGLLQEAALLDQALAQTPARGATPLLHEAQALDARATLHAFAVRSLDAELTRVTQANAEERMHELAAQLAQEQGQVTAQNRRIESLCRQTLAQFPDQTRPYVLLVRLWQRQQDVARIRQTVAELADHPGPLERTVAGTAALRLLDLEWTAGVEGTSQDLELARRLLADARLTGLPDADFRLAQAQLALAQGDWARALAVAQAASEVSDNHPRSVVQYNLALAHQGHVAEAEHGLAKLSEHWQTAYPRFVLGQAFAMNHEFNSALEQFRQALEMEPNILPPRLALVQVLMDQGRLSVAAPDIQILCRLNPRHPRVIAMNIALLMRRADMEELTRVLRQADEAVRGPTGWRTVALAAWALLEDWDRVRALAAQALRENPTDVPACFFHTLADANPEQRFPLAAMAVSVLGDVVDDDPMGRLSPSHLGTMADAGAGLPPARAQADAPAVVDDSYLGRSQVINSPWEAARSLVEAAQDKWPHEKELQAAGLVLDLWLGDVMQARRQSEILYDQPRAPAGTGGVRGAASPATTAAEEGAPAWAADRELALEVGAALREDWQHVTARPVRRGTASALEDWLAIAQALTTDNPDTVRKTTREILKARPGGEPLLLLALRGVLRRGDVDEALALLESVRLLAPRMADLAQARLHLALGQPEDAGRSLDTLLAGESAGSEWRVLAAEVRTRMALEKDHPQEAAAVLEGLAMSNSAHRAALAIGAAKMYAQAGRLGMTVPLLNEIIINPQTPPRWCDVALNNLVQMAPPERVLNLFRGYTQTYPPLLYVLNYQVEIYLRQGDMGKALEILRQIPDAADRPRIIGLRARVCLAHRDRAGAMAQWRRVAWMDNLAGWEARQLLEQFSPIPAETSETSGPGRP